VLGLLVFLALIVVLSALGLADGKIELPFGIGIDKSRNDSAELAGLVALGNQLAALQQAESKRFDRTEELAQLVQEAIARLDELERLIPKDDPMAAESN
jgi:biotin-(acetyl-CoA carboxylase) ligase